MRSPNTCLLALSSVLIFVGILFLLAPPFLPIHNENHVFLSPETSTFQSSKPNLWADLDDLEFGGVLDFLYSQHALNLTTGAETIA